MQCISTNPLTKSHFAHFKCKSHCHISVNEWNISRKTLAQIVFLFCLNLEARPTHVDVDHKDKVVFLAAVS